MRSLYLGKMVPSDYAVYRYVEPHLLVGTGLLLSGMCHYWCGEADRLDSSSGLIL
jgi:hypothetical protein